MASQKVRGVDVEATYRVPLSTQIAETLPGTSSQLRVIGTRNLENSTG